MKPHFFKRGNTFTNNLPKFIHIEVAQLNSELKHVSSKNDIIIC